MMVTFISECEKKALNRTRRVLDAFANRIGGNTWQTTITQEGLQAVKKLLRKSASKNTAVSCHWLRSRSRNELLWVVGRRDRFNGEGLVPVNYTQQTITFDMDILQMNIKQYYANTNKQHLDQHLFAVGYIAHKIILYLTSNERLAQTAYIAGSLHDIGKIDPGFQDWVLKKLSKEVTKDIPEEGQHIDKKSGRFSFEKHPRHNEISLLLYYFLNDENYKSINTRNKDLIKHAIYWHHAKPIRKNEFTSLETIYKKLKNNLVDTDFLTLIQTTKLIVQSINTLSEQYFYKVPIYINGLVNCLDEDKLYALSTSDNLPKYKHYAQNDTFDDYLKNIRTNAKQNLCRTAVISADRLVSSISAETLANFIHERNLDVMLSEHIDKTSDLSKHIQTCINSFDRHYQNSERNIVQSKTASKLANLESIGVLNGPAGCGKTKISLEWALLTNANKIIWVCPRVQVCQGLINDLTSSEYLNATTIEINTGEYKALYQSGKKSETPEGEEFSGNVVITTIDQIINTITTHTKVTGLTQFINAHVIFDEYHEYITMPAFNLLFAELVECKKLQGKKCKTLLVSATPNYQFVRKLLNIDKDDIISMPSFNQRKYKITFEYFSESIHDQSNPLYQQQPKNTIVISNTATTAQRSFIQNQESENAILMHSKYKKVDQQDLFRKTINSFKKDGYKNYDILRSGPVIQASLNITCKRMITEFTNAENTLQRLGRLDRFGENNEINLYIIAIPNSLATSGKQISNCAQFLSSLHNLQAAKVWNDFLHNELTESVVTINQIYKLYDKFYESDHCTKAVEEDLLKALKNSVDIIQTKLFDPITYLHKKPNKDRTIKLKKHSLRGNNCFVQMAVCKINTLTSYKFTNNYAYDTSDLDANLTYAIEPILGYGDSKRNLLAFMAKKHHNITEAKKSYNDNIILTEARNPETPIYLSYTTQDLEKVGGESQRHPHSIYYAIGLKQPIGAISTFQLNQNRHEEK